MHSILAQSGGLPIRMFFTFSPLLGEGVMVLYIDFSGEIHGP